MTNSNASKWTSDVTLSLQPAAAAIKPRAYQQAAWDRMTAHFTNEKRQAGLIVVPTGAGKTVLAAAWLLREHIRHGGRVLWLAHRKSLLRQAMNTFRKLGNMAFEKKALTMMAISSTDSRWSAISEDHDVVFSSIQTAVLEGNAGHLENFVHEAKNGVFVVVDEAHHSPAPGYSRLLRKVKGWGCKLIGLTATPVRSDKDDQKRLVALFDNQIIYQTTRRSLTEAGILADPNFETVKTNVNLEKDFTPEDYKYLERYGEIGPHVLQRLAKHAHRNQLIVEQYLKNKEVYGPTIVFAADTLHAQTLASEFKKRNISADYVDYSRPDAQEVIERYQTKKDPDVLVNVEMLTEGFDAPHTRTVFIARPTRSEGLVAQMVGRALRGPQSGGNEKAYLVTFLDTWQQFDVLDAEYVLRDGEDTVPAPVPAGDVSRVTISPELVREAYRLLQSNVRGQLVGVYQCLPHSWYDWDEEFEDDQQRRTVMVWDNQVDAYASMMEAFSPPESVPNEVSEDFAREQIRKFFVDTPDPLPRWADVKALLDARRKGCEIAHYTIDEKNAFNPKALAKAIHEQNLSRAAELSFLQAVWDNSPACRAVYREDIRSLAEDVSRELLDLTTPQQEPVEPQVEAIVPKRAPRAWPANESGYSLSAIRDSVLSVKRHFPHGAPTLGDITWMGRPNPRYWGFCRYSDKSISINPVLNSPDIPYFVLEHLMYHEMLHADMPTSGHNRDYRARERAYYPSQHAIEDAEQRGIKPPANASSIFWHSAACRFLDTFDRYYQHKMPGATMDCG